MKSKFKIQFVGSYQINRLLMILHKKLFPLVFNSIFNNYLDNVFDEFTNNKEIYQIIGVPSIKAAFNGIN